ncbi:MAG: deoxyhypusine synthase family protein [Thermoguttaceae bacterium]|jgi:deoxyhypusine synthase
MTRTLHDGRNDGLEPLEPLDPGPTTGLARLMEQMSKTAFGGRELGEAYHVLRAMADDPDCTIVVTVSGAMSVAKMGLVLCRMMEAGLAHLIVSTGAVLAHGLSEAIGCVHYKYDPRVSDQQLFQWGYNRVYDTLEMEANLWHAQELVSQVLEGLDWSQPLGSWQINREIGRRLVEQGQVPSILGTAFRLEVPVYVPAFTDSELGLDVAAHFLARRMAGDPGTVPEQDPEALFAADPPPLNPFLDLFDYTRRIHRAKRLGIFTIGGGVPRNWAQQVGPLNDVVNMRLGSKLPVPRFQYGVRLCPEPAHWGGLSGCTYAEGVSWGKFLSIEEGGRFAEVHCDATIAWPLLIQAVLEGRDGGGETAGGGQAR